MPRLDPLTKGHIKLYACLLWDCGNAKVLWEGKRLHACIVKDGLEGDTLLGHRLMEMYRRSGSVQEARVVFNNRPKQCKILWTTMLSSYIEFGQSEEALHLFRNMGIEPDNVCFTTILSACTSPEALADGKLIHSEIILARLDLDIVVGTAVVSMYGKCGSLEDLGIVFERMHERNTITWNAMIGYCCRLEMAIYYFQKMLAQHVKPNAVTFIIMLSACKGSAALGEGKLFHASIIENGIQMDSGGLTALMNMYRQCGCVEKALLIFTKMSHRNQLSWNTIIAASIENKQKKESFVLYQAMHGDGILPNKITFISILNACDDPESITEGRLIHANILTYALETENLVGTSLVNMYGKCHSVDEACRTFDKIKQKNLVSWTTMIAICSHGGLGKDALQHFDQMKEEGIKPDEISYVSVLDACACLAALADGRLLHTLIIDSGLESNIVVATALLNMYSKCGGLGDAHIIFHKMNKRDVVLWNAMIGAYSQHDHVEGALHLFQQMRRVGMKPDHVTFINILCACVHTALVDIGLRYFISMGNEHGITPTAEHYGCIVDLLAQAGMLDEAEDTISRMGIECNSVMWVSLLDASRIHGDLDRGKRAAEKAIELDPKLSGAYIVLSNILAGEELVRLREILIEELRVIRQ